VDQIGNQSSNTLCAPNLGERRIDQGVEDQDNIAGQTPGLGKYVVGQFQRNKDALGRSTLRLHLQSDGITGHGGGRWEDLIDNAVELVQEHMARIYAR